jgi:hypothetical protein
MAERVVYGCTRWHCISRPVFRFSSTSKVTTSLQKRDICSYYLERAFIFITTPKKYKVEKKTGTLFFLSARSRASALVHQRTGPHHPRRVYPCVIEVVTSTLNYPPKTLHLNSATASPIRIFVVSVRRGRMAAVRGGRPTSLGRQL